MAKLFVIAGHGAGDPGACAGGHTEADLVRGLSARLKALGGAEVIVGDTSVSWYDTNGIGRGQCPAGVPVIELHMDSAGAGAKGGHVIIKAGFEPDAYDRALAGFIGEFFPGRANKIVGRSELANPNRAAAAGVNYRLLECCFISNDGDRAKFINQMDDVARGILGAFGIAAGPAPAPKPEPEPQPQPAPNPAAIKVDGFWGSNTTRRAQEVAGLTADGEVWGQNPDHQGAMPACTTGWCFDYGEPGDDREGSPLVSFLQGKWGVKQDGVMGPVSINAMIAYYMERGSGAERLDGRLDAESPTVKAFQRELNAGRI